MPLRLLILGCSARKCSDLDDLPALKRYDGPSFRVLRKFLRQSEKPDAVRVGILSARYGLVNADAPTPFYNERMTELRAHELGDHVLSSLAQTFVGDNFESVLFSLGRDYWAALDGWREIVPHHVRVVVAHGSSGRRAALLREWLCGEAEIAPFPAQTQEVHLGGRNWEFQPEDVLEVARRRLRECEEAGDPAPARFHSWCARVDGHVVAPKWLLSQVTGLPTRAFHTEQACRALAKWGIDIERQSLLKGESEKIPEDFRAKV